jgi:AcrR family transcriptional regulator
MRKLAAKAPDTRARLVSAATKEFCSYGFSGTDSNKIARRAGFAPQTFYRWFADKVEIFVVVYREWEDEERQTMSDLITHQADVTQLAQAIVAHHRTYRVFRRSLRQLAIENTAVRKARTDSRVRQIEQISLWSSSPDAWTDTRALTLLQIERLADAAAEDELDDLGISPEKAFAAIAELITRLRN